MVGANPFRTSTSLNVLGRGWGQRSIAWLFPVFLLVGGQGVGSRHPVSFVGVTRQIAYVSIMTMVWCCEGVRSIKGLLWDRNSVPLCSFDCVERTSSLVSVSLGSHAAQAFGVRLPCVGEIPRTYKKKSTEALSQLSV